MLLTQLSTKYVDIFSLDETGGIAKINQTKLNDLRHLNHIALESIFHGEMTQIQVKQRQEYLSNRINNLIRLNKNLHSISVHPEFTCVVSFAFQDLSTALTDFLIELKGLSFEINKSIDILQRGDIKPLEVSEEHHKGNKLKVITMGNGEKVSDTSKDLDTIISDINDYYNNKK